MNDTARAAIEERIKQILISELQVDPGILDGIGLSTALLGRGLGLDSMETLGLVVALEEEFGIHVDDGDFMVELFRSVGTLAEYVAKNTAGQGHRSAEGSYA